MLEKSKVLLLAKVHHYLWKDMNNFCSVCFTNVFKINTTIAMLESILGQSSNNQSTPNVGNPHKNWSAGRSFFFCILVTKCNSKSNMLLVGRSSTWGPTKTPQTPSCQDRGISGSNWRCWIRRNCVDDPRNKVLMSLDWYLRRPEPYHHYRSPSLFGQLYFFCCFRRWWRYSFGTLRRQLGSVKCLLMVVMSSFHTDYTYLISNFAFHAHCFQLGRYLPTLTEITNVRRFLMH